ncbi:hypothetical protein B484DRAFT_404835 [Ochromonadaceae sp. CCMP2298]|nr:hypothetical protein B484DRAFT_404835 [Ochromonadaceae sp. CCMP2298]
MAFTDVVGLFHLILLLSAIIFLSQDLQWDKIDVQTLGESRFRAIPTLHLAVFRSLCATLVMGSTLYLTLSPTPLCVTVQLKGGRKKLVSLLHFERFSMFTVWSWLMLGLYFSGAAYCSYVALRGGAPSTLTLRVVWVLFEVCFPIGERVSRS